MLHSCQLNYIITEIKQTPTREEKKKQSQKQYGLSNSPSTRSSSSSRYRKLHHRIQLFPIVAMLFSLIPMYACVCECVCACVTFTFHSWHGTKELLTTPCPRARFTLKTLVFTCHVKAKSIEYACFMSNADS